VADMPPPDNNYSIAGDMVFNTGQNFNVGATYDLFTVAMHEIGHALGLDHSSTGAAVLYPTYTSTRSALGTDDIAGIRSIYDGNAPRTPDAYDAAAANNSFAAASNLTPLIDPSAKTALVTNLDITTTADVDYYRFTAPQGTGSTLTVTVQSKGLSLLAPTLTVFDGAQNQLGTASGAGRYGSTFTVTVTGVTAGQTFYVKVAGSAATALGTGSYAVALNFGSGASPAAPAPNTQTANGSTMSAGGSQPQKTSLLGG